MNGVIAKAMWGGGLLVCLASSSGCLLYRDLHDQCWPQRYNAVAREEVRGPLEIQAQNGLILEQTLWNEHFGRDEKGNTVLSPRGMAYLDRLARRRPCPAPDVFVQTAHDVAYDPAKPIDANRQDRDKLDLARVEAVRNYLLFARPDVPFNVAVHDPSPVGLIAGEGQIMVAGHAAGARGGLQVGAETRQVFNTIGQGGNTNAAAGLITASGSGQPNPATDGARTNLNVNPGGAAPNP